MNEVYSVREVAAAAGTSEESILQLADFEQILIVDDLVAEAEALRLVRAAWQLPGGRAPLTPLAPPRRRTGGPLAMSGGLHAAFALLIVVASSWEWLQARDTEVNTPPKVESRLVFLMSPGPGGGGGGGGMKVPVPPPKAERKAPAPRKVSSPAPPPRPYRPPPRPVSQPVVTPPPAPTPPPIQAPVASVAAETREVPGVIEAPPAPPAAPPSPGPGIGGGVGSGQGTGIGEGEGSGIGAGSGGGTGGGPFRPGSGIEPPQLVREVRPLYTDDARRRAVEGDVVLEIIVRRDGTVGDVKVLRALGSGLEQRAIAAVRQWRFSPARRQGAAVDVVVEVAVGFTLR